MSLLSRLSASTSVFSRSLSASAVTFKQIKHKETDKKIVVEGVLDNSKDSRPETKIGSWERCGNAKHECHPFCKSPIVGEVKHTDVLILDQFIDSKGQMYSSEDLKICPRQWTRLFKLVQMSQRAGLMPGKEFYCAEYRKTKWGRQNCYWDEKTIDIQWNWNATGRKIKEYKTGMFKHF